MILASVPLLFVYQIKKKPRGQSLGQMPRGSLVAGVNAA